MTPTPVSPPVTGTPVFLGSAVSFSKPNPNGFSGTLTSSVIQESPVDNPLGGVTFVYVLHNNSSSVSALEQLTVSDFSGFATDVSYAPTGQAPTSTDRSPNGAVVRWTFTGTPVGAGVLAPGADSGELIIRTDSPAYALPTTAGVIDGATVDVDTIGPSLTVIITPEPASLGLLFVSALALGRTRFGA